MKRSEIFPSKWIKADDVVEETELVIQSVKLETLQSPDGKTEEKPVCRFRGIDKGLILGKTNWDRIEKQHGEDSDDWVGKSIILFAEAEARSESGYSARVKIPLPKPAAKLGGGLKPAAKPQPADQDGDNVE